MNWVEITGYAASLLVAVALSMSSIARLRALNLLGAFVFAVYGWMVGAYPVLVVNAYIVVINMVFLIRMQPGRSEAFELLSINRLENRYLQRFLDFYQAWSEVIQCESISRFVVKGDVGPHQSYLKKIGFHSDENLGDGWLSRPATDSG